MSDIDLNAPATLSSLALLVGVSRQAMQKLNATNPFPQGESNLVWLHTYVGMLRESAAGRGGDDQKGLTTWRKEEAKENALLKRLDRLQREGALVIADDVVDGLTAWSGVVVQSIDHAVNNATERIESKHGVQLDDDDLGGYFRSACRDIGAAANQFTSGISASVDGTDSTGAAADG